MRDQSGDEDDQLGVECVIDGCEARLVGLRDGWPSSTREGPVCADCWDFNSEHGHFPDEESVRDLLTDGGQLDGGNDRIDAGSVSTNTLTAVPEHLAHLANGDPTWNAEKIVLKTGAGDVAIVARDGGLAVEQA